MRLTEEEAKQLGYVKDKSGNWSYRGSAADTIRPARVQRNDPGEVSKLESSSSRWIEGKNEAQRIYEADCKGGYRIVVTAFCRKHTDPDNLCPKWFVDRLKEYGIIPDDSSEYVAEFVKRVRKIESWQPEITMIEVYEWG